MMWGSQATLAARYVGSTNRYLTNWIVPGGSAVVCTVPLPDTDFEVDFNLVAAVSTGLNFPYGQPVEADFPV